MSKLNAYIRRYGTDGASLLIRSRFPNKEAAQALALALQEALREHAKANPTTDPETEERQ